MTNLPVTSEVLPTCRWRGSLLPTGRYGCNSPKLFAPQGVTANDCRGCSLCNHAPAPDPKHGDSRTPSVPRLSISELAAKRSRCREAKQAGRPCTEFDDMRPRPRWTYGVTTVPQRMGDLLPRTLKSLSVAGFDSPRLFVDGTANVTDYKTRWPTLDVTTRYPPVGPVGNWILALYELYIRNPDYDRYAIFQDDLVCYHNLRAYLDKCDYPDGVHPRSVKGYWNLFTFMLPNEMIIRNDTTPGWKEAASIPWHQNRYQFGYSATGLVFNNAAVQILLGTDVFPRKVADCNLLLRTRPIDGTVVTAMNHAGWREFIHGPTLIQHTGIISSIGNGPNQLAGSFRGEDFDALDFLK